MPPKDYKTIFGFSEQWFMLGVVTEESLPLSAAEYEASGDRNSEHYRYGAFRWYLSQHRPLAAPDAEALYELGNADSDYSMGGAIMADIIDLPECPPCVLAKALLSDRKYLVRKAERRRLNATIREQQNEHFRD